MNKTRTLLAAAVCAAFTACANVATSLDARIYMGAPAKVQQRQFYSLQSKQTDAGKVVELLIYDEIGFLGTTAKAFVEQLHALAADADEILVGVNSPGGDVFDAFAIYNALRRYAGKVTTRVDGVAASAASLVVMAGDKVIMPENAMMMIHNPWTIMIGTAEDMRKTADMMDKARDGIVAAYRAKSGKDEAEIIQMMDDETWMTALEAQALGFADVIEEPVKLAASLRTGELLARFQKTPSDLLDQLELQPNPVATSGEGDPPADPAPDPAPQPNPDPVPQPDPLPENPSALAAHVFTSCRAAGIAHLAEGVLVTAGLQNREAVDARVNAAKEIASLCVAAKLPDMAASLVAAGMDVEQARARLFDEVTAKAAGELNNRSPADSVAQPPQAGPNASAIYAKRKQAISK